MARQIPKAWKAEGVEVVVNQPVKECDVWVVYQGLYRPESCVVPPNRVFFFGYEPPGLHDYNDHFLRQFSKVVSCHDKMDHPGLVLRQQAQPWLAGVTRHHCDNVHTGFGVRYSIEDFASMSPPRKDRTLSVVCSRKVMVPGHQDRLDFLGSLKRDLGDDLDIYGYGFRPVEDKWDGLAPYTYHLVLENSCATHYWTEKLADAYLAWCVPIVRGCPNLADYFPNESFIQLDPGDPERAARIVKETVNRPPTDGQRSAVMEARRRILEDYNLFAEIRRMAETTPSGPPQNIRLKDERLFLPGGWWRPFVRLMTDRCRFINDSFKRR